MTNLSKNKAKNPQKITAKLRGPPGFEKVCDCKWGLEFDTEIKEAQQKHKENEVKLRQEYLGNKLEKQLRWCKEEYRSHIDKIHFDYERMCKCYYGDEDEFFSKLRKKKIFAKKKEKAQKMASKYRPLWNTWIKNK